MEGLNDLRHCCTGVMLTHAERMEAQLRHIAAMNDARLAKMKSLNRHRCIKPCTIGAWHLSPGVVRSFSYITVGTLR
jgi:hypothetical protein